jgi:hypothetical protein
LVPNPNKKWDNKTQWATAKAAPMLDVRRKN